MAIRARRQPARRAQPHEERSAAARASASFTPPPASGPSTTGASRAIACRGCNWVDDGALSLGIASFAIVDGAEALVYDTHVSVPHARASATALAAAGVEALHRGAQPLAPRPHRRHRRLRRLRGDRQRASPRRCSPQQRERDRGRHPGGPAGDLPAGPPHAARSSDRETVDVGPTEVELIHGDIHSDDATVIWLPARRTARRRHDGGHRHLRHRARPASTDPRRRPRAPARARPAGASCPTTAIPTSSPAAAMPRASSPPPRTMSAFCCAPARAGAARHTPARLRRDAVAAGWMTYFAPYEAVHAENLKAVAPS